VTAAVALDLYPAGTVTAEWTDNLSHSALATDQLAGEIFSAGGSLDRRFSLTRDLSLLAGGTATAEICPQYDGLDQVAAGLQLELREKFGLGALAPVLSLRTEAGAASFGESARDGWSAKGALGVAKRLNDAWRVTVNADWSHQEARQQVFDCEKRGLSAELSWDVTDRWQVGLGARREWGQQEASASWNAWSYLSYGGAGPALANYYEQIPYVYSSTFGPGWVAYRVRGQTNLWWLSLSPALGANTALPLRFESVEVYAAAGTRYISHQVSLSIVHRF
jgi:hypothetical protein